MNAKIEFIKNIPNEQTLKKSSHHLVIVDSRSTNYPFEALLKNKLKLYLTRLYLLI